MHRDLEAELVLHLRIDAHRGAERATRRQARRVPAFGRPHAAALEWLVDKLARRVVDQRLRIDPGLEVAGAHGDHAADPQVRVRVAQADDQLALDGVLRALVDCAVDRDHEAHDVLHAAAHADACVLQLEAIVAADELDVRIVLHRDVLHAQVAERLPRKRRLLDLLVDELGRRDVLRRVTGRRCRLGRGRWLRRGLGRRAIGRLRGCDDRRAEHDEGQTRASAMHRRVR
jgi:hypothetical protein